MGDFAMIASNEYCEQINRLNSKCKTYHVTSKHCIR